GRRAVEQLRPDAGVVDDARAGGGASQRGPAVDPRARGRGPPRPRARVPAERRDARGAPQGRDRPHAPRARDRARLLEDSIDLEPRRERYTGGSVFRARARALLSRAPLTPVQSRAGPAPAAPRDRR